MEDMKNYEKESDDAVMSASQQLTSDSWISHKRELTLGESRVRMSFNPSNNPAVDEIKGTTARLIDLLEDMRGVSVDGGLQREISEAQTHYETAAMWAVKAATH